MKNIFITLRLLAVMTVLTGILYPLSLLAVARFFPAQAGGSVIMHQGRLVGSALLAQKNESPRFFQPRPSAADYATLPSGASNLGPTSAVLARAIAERRAFWGPDAPVELLMTSGSGLDPHLSPEAAAFQASRVAEARGVPEAGVLELIKKLTEGPQFGFLGEPRVRILELNLALDDSGNP
ncbi:MAG: potassium-transporting ATPase subunit KdpC [Terrimicrobiaceae bacterium]